MDDLKYRLVQIYMGCFSILIGLAVFYQSDWNANDWAGVAATILSAVGNIAILGKTMTLFLQFLCFLVASIGSAGSYIYQHQ